MDVKQYNYKNVCFENFKKTISKNVIHDIRKMCALKILKKPLVKM